MQTTTQARRRAHKRRPIKGHDVDLNHLADGILGNIVRRLTCAAISSSQGGHSNGIPLLQDVDQYLEELINEEYPEFVAF